MVDCISLEKREVDWHKLKNNSALDWKTTIDKHGEVIKHYAAFRGLYVQLIKYMGKGEQLWNLTIKNSLHKFYHGNNWSDFTYHQLCSSIDNLCEILHVEPEELRVKSFEFGVNIETPRPTKEIWDKYLMYRRTRFEDIRWKVGEGKVNGVVCKNTEFWIKVYDKGKQYNKSEYILRFEISIKKMRAAKNTYGLPIYTLQDFKNENTFEHFKTILSVVYDDIKRLEFIDIERLEKRQQKTVLNGLETDWKRLNGLSKDKFTKRWQTFNQLQQLAKTEDVHGQVKQLILSKCDQLLISGNKQELYQDSPHLKSVPSTSYYQDSLFICNGNLSKLTQTQLERFRERKCVVCNKDISHKRRNAKTCSKTCRNKKSNRYNNPLRAVKRDLKNPTLFPVLEHLDTRELLGA